MGQSQLGAAALLKAVWWDFRLADGLVFSLLEKLVNVRKIRHDTSVKFTEQVPYSFFPLVYGIKCVSVTFHRLAIPTEYQVSRKFMPILPMTELLCNF